MAKNKENLFKRKDRAFRPNTKQIDEKDRKHKFVTRPKASEKMLAKSAWLSGLRDSEVLKIGNCTPLTLEKWQTEWRNDRNKALLALRGKQLELSVSEVEINEHQDYIDNLRTLKIQYEAEIPMIDSTVSLLQDMLDKLSRHPDFDSKDFRSVVTALKVYTEAKSHRAALQGNYITCVNQLNQETGITAYHKAAGNKINEAYKAEGRLEIARKRQEEGLETSTEKREKGFFDVE